MKKLILILTSLVSSLTLLGQNTCKDKAVLVASHPQKTVLIDEPSIIIEGVINSTTLNANMVVVTPEGFWLYEDMPYRGMNLMFDTMTKNMPERQIALIHEKLFLPHLCRDTIPNYKNNK